MTRAAAWLLVALLLASVPAARAQDDADARRTAVAPAQTIVDASARIVDSAMAEAERDGTPDAAAALLQKLVQFQGQIGDAPQLSPTATYRDLTLASLRAAAPLPGALRSLLEDVARLATATERCANGKLSPEDIEAVAGSRLYVKDTARSLRSIVAQIPADVDASALRGAAGRLDGWADTVAVVVDCAHVTPPEHLLTFDVRPAAIEPTGTINLSGISTDAGDVRLRNDALGLDVVVPLAQPGRFSTSYTLPLATPHGRAAIVATQGNLTATRTLVVQPLPSRLAVTGPARVEPLANVTLTLLLTSPRPALSGNATIAYDGALNGTVTLVDGRGKLAFPAPNATGPLRVTFRYPGGQVVGPATFVYAVDVAAAGPQVPTQQEQESSNPIPILILGAALLALAGFAAFRLARRSRAPSRAAGGARAADAPDEARPRGLLLAVTMVVRLLRRLGLVRASATIREMRPVLRRFDPRSDDVVIAFERARYRGDAEPEDDARPWADQVRAKAAEESA